MSSPQVFIQAASGRHFDFVAQDFEFPQPGLSRLGQCLAEMPKLAGVTPASRLEFRATPAMVSSGIAEIDSLTEGLARGCLTEICGPASSGRSSVLLAAMAAATERQEVCALVDSSDALNPQSAAAAGVDLRRLLWVRCSASQGGHIRTGHTNHFRGADEKSSHRAEFSALENVLRVTDLLLQSSGFGLVAIDLGDVPYKVARRIPLTSWFRFRRAVENTSTVLLVISRESCAATCASLLLQLEGRGAGIRHPASGFRHPASGFRLGASGREASGSSSPISEKNMGVGTLPSHAEILEALQIRAELLRSRLERKPVRSLLRSRPTHCEFRSDCASSIRTSSIRTSRLGST